MPNFAVTRTPQLDYFFSALTSDTISKMTGGRIKPMTPEQASGLIGSWIVETGDPTLSKLDVVEKGAAAGRGLSQYTGARRIPYDQQRQAAIAQGQDPNSPEWQLQYFANEYVGKYDPAPGKSLIGWTRVFENAPAQGTPADYAGYYTGSAAAGTGYFRPGVPHTQSRANAAQQVHQLYGAATRQPPRLTIPTAPPPRPVPQATARPNTASAARQPAASRPGWVNGLGIPSRASGRPNTAAAARARR